MHTTAAGPSETWGAAEQLTLTGTWTAAPSTVAVWSENVNDTVTVTMVYAARYLKMGYLRLAGAYEFSYRVNGGAWVASGSLAGGSIAYQFLEVDCGSDGLHTVDFRVDSGYLCIEGFMTRREAAGGLQVHNSGLNGARPSTSYLDGLYQQSVTPVWTVADPVLTVIQFGTNNWNNQDDVAGSEADLLSLVNTTKVRHPNTEILLMSMYPVNQADKAIGQAEYVAAQAEVAASSADYYLDTWTRWMALDGSTFSSYYFDGLHPNPLGNAENAGVILDLLLGL
jgi:lysophospholipase L1-like esterase